MEHPSSLEDRIKQLERHTDEFQRLIQSLTQRIFSLERRVADLAATSRSPRPRDPADGNSRRLPPWPVARPGMPSDLPPRPMGSRLPGFRAAQTPGEPALGGIGLARSLLPRSSWECAVKAGVSRSAAVGCFHPPGDLFHCSGGGRNGEAISADMLTGPGRFRADAHQGAPGGSTRDGQDLPHHRFFGARRDFAGGISDAPAVSPTAEPLDPKVTPDG